MSILDRYVARQFLTNVVILLALLSAFVVAIDASLNVDEFLSAARDLAASRQEDASFVRTTLLTIMLVVDLWWPRLLQLFNFMLGLVMVGAMGFTLAQMSRHRELVAILASGQSLFRVARPIMVVAVGLTLVQAVNGELVLPRIAPLLARERNDAATRSLAPTRIPLARDGQGQVFYAEEFDAIEQELRGVRVWVLDESSRPTARITADDATWREGAWQLRGGQVRRSGPEGLGDPEPISRIESDLDPTQLMMLRYRGFSRSMSFAQAGRLLGSLNQLDDRQARRLERIKWGRVPVMLANLLALAIAIPFFLAREPRPMLTQTLKAAPLSMGAVMAGVIGSAVGIPGVSPGLGVFLPVLVLTPMAIGQMVRLGHQT
ncbi:MAG: LptF/LptG family permease [Phycisphaerales bacterium]|nr:LptF/LptG family permease [Phycisphaerales bacterium]